MAICPKHKIQLQRVRKGISYVCPICDYKEYIPARYSLPEVRKVIDLPTSFAWVTWTLTNVEANGDNQLVLSTGVTSGYAVSPQLMNLTRDTNRFKDVSKVKMSWTDSRQSGKIEYHASNDSGTGYIRIKTQNAIFNLPYGNELRQYKQANYDDLRVKIILERTLSSDTSPSVTKLIVKHD